MTATDYRQAARAAGAWAVRLTPDRPTAAVGASALLEHLASARLPLTGYVERRGDLLGEVLLARDPSVTHGTPSVGACKRVVSGLRGWHIRPLEQGVLVAFGLREGYDEDGRVHRATEVAELLAPPTEVEERWLVSARLVPGTASIRWWHEPCAVVTAPEQAVDRLDAVAAALGQHRYTITDWTRGHTTARATGVAR
ncbi:hypothetical protein [Actinosynnema mirum]|uniref:Uncharacterized protein n=1 Tax=Actinosynnema mirum (strain ATCC 29888 / DSM 43827 / JCM 3225 / NBRC 14064 / NCIMB 13271 / NRRL B-12336 / IMRU 3971 / 101) TaxID=446462 RepID=C6WBA6_ACTMD|nr:hypothetical protein [Actinosynnema mirum]ACU39397.1 hypothetical protein Amir_5579 [Actinosynnema mirum DSM 43827]